MNTDAPDNEFIVRAFDLGQPLRVYRQHLPHWRQEGVLYFVTFRLADSIPAQVLKDWEEDRRRWLAAHGITGDLLPDEWTARYRELPEDVRRAFERETARRFLVELDKCHASCAFRDPAAARIVDAAMRFHHGKRLRCGDFVIMPNHVHWLVAPESENALEDLLGSVKRFSAVRINKLAGTRGTLWQKESFDHIVRANESLLRFREYIRDNPAKARLRPGEYGYYNAEWLS